MPLLQHPATQQPSMSTPVPSPSVQELAVAASVRLRVEDETGHSYGTGTVIDVHGQEALVLTCAHIFRDSGGRGRIDVDRFDAGAAETSAGTLISHDYDQDVALVSMQLLRPIRAARLARSGSRIAVGQEVFSVGCNHGQPPTVVAGRVNSVNKYMRKGNLTASGRPVDGRSGGGLFSRDGTLLGVCNAADPELDEGLYAMWTRVHEQLDRQGLSFVYRDQTGPSPTSDPTGAVVSGNAASPEVSPVSHQAVPATVEVPGDGGLRPLPVTTAGKDELVCVIRSGSKEHRVIVVENPTAELLTRLMQEAQP